MPTTSRVSEAQLPDHGGHPVVLRVNWSEAEAEAGTVFAPSTICRLLVRQEDPDFPGQFLDLGDGGDPRELFSGRPGQVFESTDDAGRTGFQVVYPVAVDAGNTRGTWIVGTGNVQVPKAHVLRAYTPKLPAAIYWIQGQQHNAGTNAWDNVGLPVALRVLPRARIASIYRVRGNIPSPPYLPGAQNPGDEPMLEG